MGGGRVTECPHCGKNVEKDYCSECFDEIAKEECCGKFWCRDCYQEHVEEMGRRKHLRP
jgi:predicted amidophosphoribosyltransferase